MPDLSDADPVGEVLTFMRTDEQVLALFGGADYISGILEAPWPHLTIRPGDGGDLRGLAGGSMVGSVRVEVTGPLDGTVGSADLWVLSMKVLLAAVRMSDKDPAPGRPVVSLTEPSDSLARQALTSGQTRYIATLNVTVSPPQG